MRLQTDAVRGIRWAAMGSVLVLGLFALSRIVSAPPAEGAGIDSSTELVAGEPAGLDRGENMTSPPMVPPPPPLPGEVRRPRRVVKAPVELPPVPVETPLGRPFRPRVLNAEPVTLVAVAAPIEMPEPMEIAVDVQPELGTPGHPIIIRPPAPPRTPHPALRMLKSVGWMFGVRRKRLDSQEPQPAAPEL